MFNWVHTVVSWQVRECLQEAFIVKKVAAGIRLPFWLQQLILLNKPPSCSVTEQKNNNKMSLGV